MKAMVKNVKGNKIKVTISVTVSATVIIGVFVTTAILLFRGGNSGLRTTSTEINGITETSISTLESEYETNADKILLQNKPKEEQIFDTPFNEFSDKDTKKDKLLSDVTVEQFVLDLDGKEKQIQDLIGTRSEEVLEYTIEESESVSNNQIVITMSSPDEIYNYFNTIKPIANRTNNPVLFSFMGDGLFKLHKEFKEINQGEFNDYLDNSESYFKNALYFSQDLKFSNNTCAYLSNVYAERHRIMYKGNDTDEEVETLLTIIAYGNISLGDGSIDTTLQSIPKYNIAYSYHHLYMVTDDSNILLKEYFYSQSKDKYNEIDLNSSYFIQARNDLANLEEVHNQTIHH